MSRSGSGSHIIGRGSISRREALRRAALGLGAVALLGAEPALAAPLTAAEQVTSPRVSAPTTVRQGAGTVTIYSALNESTNNAFTEAFKASTPGIDTAVLPLAAAGELQTRIQTEKDSPKCDVFIGGDQAFHEALGKQGILEQYFSPNAATVDPAYKDPNGFWTGCYIGIF
jgi:iron(III) transport system substrate-binding protein